MFLTQNNEYMRSSHAATLQTILYCFRIAVAIITLSMALDFLQIRLATSALFEIGLDL